MRLVDADKVITTRYDYEKPLTLKERLYRLLDNQPTVEAIPVEWFKKKIGWLSDKGVYGAEVYQWVLNRWYEDKEDWEKENERER